MSALTDFKARITDAEGHLRDRTTIAAELERAISEESTRAQNFSESHEWIAWTGSENLVPYRLYLLQTEDTEEENGMPSAVVVGYPKQFSYGWDWIHPGANVRGKVLFFRILPEDINPPLWPGLHGKIKQEAKP